MHSFIGNFEGNERECVCLLSEMTSRPMSPGYRFQQENICLIRLPYSANIQELMLAGDGIINFMLIQNIIDELYLPKDWPDVSVR